jgi:hypothetical protein
MFGVYDKYGDNTSANDAVKLIDMYRVCGIKNLSSANNNRGTREASVMLTLQRMQNGKLFIFNTLHKTLREYRMYARKEGIIKDGNDHLMDAMRYVIMSGLSLARTKENVMNPWTPQQFKPRDHPQGNWMR